MIFVVALICAVSMASIAGYFVYTIVPYNKADAEWAMKYGKLTKEESEWNSRNSQRRLSSDWRY